MGMPLTCGNVLFGVEGQMSQGPLAGMAGKARCRAELCHVLLRSLRVTPLLWCHRRDELFVLIHSFRLRFCHLYVALPVGECHPVSASPPLGSQARCAPGTGLEGEISQVPVGAGRILVGSEFTGKEQAHREPLSRTGSV